MTEGVSSQLASKFLPPDKIDITPDTVAALDLDCALIQSYKLADIVYAVARSQYHNDPIRLQTIADIKLQQDRLVGQDPAYIDDLKVQLGEPDFLASPSKLARSIVSQNSDSDGKLTSDFVELIMVDGALDYIAALERAAADWLIVTAGGLFSQQVKLELLRLILVDQGLMQSNQTLSYIVTSPEVRKIDLLYAATTQGGMVDIDQLASLDHHGVQASQLVDRLVGARYNRVVLTDDKLTHLESSSNDSLSSRPLVVVAILVKRCGQADQPGSYIADVASAVRSAA